MKRKLTAIFLTLLITISLLPTPAMAAVSDEEKDEIKSIVTDLVTDYAAKVYQPNSDDAAFSTFLKHGLYGNGADLVLTEDSPMVATLFNACLMQETLIGSITASITKMQNTNLDRFYARGEASWHNWGYRGCYFGVSNGTEWDPDDFAGTIYSDESYEGPTNENDKVMELIGGGVYASIKIKEAERKSTTVVYDLELNIYDEFDFDSDYGEISEMGYDTSTDQDLVNLGFLLTFVGLDEFEWYYNKSFQLEVPIRHTHSSYNYHLTYDGSTATISSESGNGFTENPVTTKTYTYLNNGETITRYYHELENTVVLKHDKPWVIEWDRVTAQDLQFSVGDPGNNNVHPMIWVNSQSYVWLYFQRLVLPESGSSVHQYYYVGVKTAGKFEYDPTHRYTYTLENVINADGSNMIYLSVYDNDLGTQVLAPEPMDDLWFKEDGQSQLAHNSSASNYAVGHDILINYIGNKYNGLSSPDRVLDIRIWENGKDALEDEGTYTAPTCTTDGGMLHSCDKCGNDYLTDIEPALGHSFTEYVEDGNAACTENGTKSRECIRCGETETVAIENTALGHNFGEYISDGNVTCTEDGTETRTCSRCNLTETRTVEGSATGHSFGNYTYDHNATCLEDGTKTATCANCGVTDVVTAEGSALGHNYKAAVTEPTCTEQGYTTYTCHCGDSYVDDYTEVIPHSEVIDPAVKSTCVTNGKTEGKHCEVCGLVTVKQKNLATSDHTWDEGVATNKPGYALYTCIHCGATTESIATEPAPGFSDVPADAWYAAAVNWAKKQGITSGLTETLFGSNNPCTRGQVVTFLWAAAGKPQPASTKNPFNDVSESDYYYTPVLWAVEQGITGGVGEGMFGPDQSCTRGQIVTFLWRAMNSPEVEGTNGFTDVKTTDYFATPVQWAAENEVTGGIGDGQFGPNQTCTRAQVVTFLYKVYG